MPLEHSPTVSRILACAIHVHRALGPGLLESAYQRCLKRAFERERVAFVQQITMPVPYDGMLIECGYRVDFIVENTVILEIKSVERLLPIHTAQTLTYLKLSKLRFGLLMNFNVPLLKEGVKSLFRPDRESQASSQP